MNTIYFALHALSLHISSLGASLGSDRIWSLGGQLELWCDEKLNTYKL